VIETAAVVVTEDAPIMATYDCRDLLSHRQAIHATFGLTVAHPDEVLRALSPMRP
jgi:hypothetical protein